MVVRKVVFVRHGESQGNAKNVYTGWGATPLSVLGEQEAVEAGLCIKASGVMFDTVYTSFLSRAVKTCELVLNTSGNDSVPIIKNWRLNARHSGALQGLTPQEAVSLFGEAKVQLWRSSYAILPKCVEESDARHPVNDPLYADVPRGFLPQGGESLKHVVERVVPYWREHIVPRIQQGDSIMIVAHKNSFRALWQYIERISDEESVDVAMMPASAPLVFEFEDHGEHGLIFKSKYIMNLTSFNPQIQGGNALGKVFFLRHAETVNNSLGVDNGWEDSALTLKGEEQAAEAGMCFKKHNIKVDVIFTSVLQRAVKTAEIACMTSNNAFAVPVFKSWRLNARHSGALHGMSQEEAVATFGEAVAEFRTTNGYPPKSLDRTDPRHPANDPLYASETSPDDLPSGESYDLMKERVLGFWVDSILPHITEGKSVLIVAHRNPLKAIVESMCDESEMGKFDSYVRSTLPFAHAFAMCESTGKPVVMAKYGLSSFTPQLSPTLKVVGKAVFLRHGESECNVTGAFTGWEDSGLTPKGEKQAEEAGQYLASDGWKISMVFTSVLSRALESVERIAKSQGMHQFLW
jgi:2,3-bisphosphoglycerate-dependent phosphoglycerate mutase